jgi:hypothetical protein
LCFGPDSSSRNVLGARRLDLGGPKVVSYAASAKINRESLNLEVRWFCCDSERIWGRQVEIPNDAARAGALVPWCVTVVRPSLVACTHALAYELYEGSLPSLLVCVIPTAFPEILSPYLFIS